MLLAHSQNTVKVKDLSAGELVLAIKRTIDTLQVGVLGALIGHLHKPYFCAKWILVCQLRSGSCSSPWTSLGRSFRIFSPLQSASEFYKTDLGFDSEQLKSLATAGVDATELHCKIMGGLLQPLFPFQGPRRTPPLHLPPSFARLAPLLCCRRANLGGIPGRLPLRRGSRDGPRTSRDLPAPLLPEHRLPDPRTRHQGPPDPAVQRQWRHRGGHPAAEPGHRDQALVIPLPHVSGGVASWGHRGGQDRSLHSLPSPARQVGPPGDQWRVQVALLAPP